MGKRNFDLMSRNENTREKVQRKVVRFEIRQIRQHFEESLCAIHASLPLRMISGILEKKKKQKISGVHKSYF